MVLALAFAATGAGLREAPVARGWRCWMGVGVVSGVLSGPVRNSINGPSEPNRIWSVSSSLVSAEILWPLT